MPLELIVLIAAVVVTGLVFSALINVIKTSLQTAITVAIIVFVLQLLFGIGPGQLLETIINLPRTIWLIFNK